MAITNFSLFSRHCQAQLEADNWMYGYRYYVNFNQASVPDTIAYPNLISGLQLGKALLLIVTGIGAYFFTLVVGDIFTTGISRFFLPLIYLHTPARVQ